MTIPHLPETSARAAFRQAVTLATLHALDNLPDANGRVERARDLVLTGAVTPHEDGVFVVRGLGTNGKDYTVTDDACTCPDAAKANTCKHIIAVWIWRKAEAAVQEQGATPQPAPAHTVAAGSPRLLQRLPAHRGPHRADHLARS